MGRDYNTNCVLHPRPLRRWYYFLLFYMCHSTMGLTRCYKTANFYIYCDHTVHASADLSLWLDSPTF